MKFIKLNRISGSPVFVNPSLIATLVRQTNKSTFVVFPGDEHTYEMVKETPEQIIKLINDD